ncbi:cytochrome P450 [Echria macrotheca]|uniref:Bifunctional cytochrome P450/NADPH--P450 reductase n=1 Tax=Echria macrotheca TaxID=438768 RepID=A0AAJ0BBE1_9PEZI|nr:cytochrome P450 [Echria macrotheca]
MASCPFHTSKPAPASSPAPHPHPVPAPTLVSDHPTEEIPDGEPIPHPPERFLTQNLSELDRNFLASSFWRLADTYGPIFSLNLIKRRVVVLSSHTLIDEVSDDEHFEKYVTGVQEEVRTFVKNGLFTSYSDEEEWGIAHRTLVPVFGPLHVRKMFGQMTDILSQMILRWDRFGPETRINTMDDFTRLAFDVIGLCAFNYRFNAFYGEDLIPFAKQLGSVLRETGRRTDRLAIQNYLHFRDKKQMMDDIHAMWKVCDDIVADRRQNPRPDVDDILSVMLTAKDPVTGKGFTDENIRYQMATFLVAGHDTSAGTLMFLFYNLLQHPEALQKCYAEVDAVLGGRPLELEDIPKLKYIEACLRETLRALGPIAMYTRHAKKTRLLAGKYKVTPDMALVLNLKGLHHDPAVWGDDANEFRPERFLNGGWERLPANAWKPFGTGVRSCIGRYLAEQEIMITMAMVLQRFNVEMADPDYRLKIKSTLTIKPENFYLKVKRRPGRDHLFTFGNAPVPTPKAAPNGTNGQSKDAEKTNLKPITVLYGGNTGTCKSFSEDLQTDAPNFGLGVPAGVQNLDEGVEHLPANGKPVIIITSSYEGKPPDNGRNFVAWLETRAADPAKHDTMLWGVRYAVFGAGNKDWATTFHRIPRLVDELMAKLGATRLVPAGYVDVSEDIIGPFEEWKLGLFPALRKATGVETAIQQGDDIAVTVAKPDTPSKLAGEDVSEGTVIDNKVLAPSGVGLEKRQIDILLAPGVEYQSGDYLVVQPFNPVDSVNRVLRRFGLHADDVVTVSNTKKEHLLSSSETGPLSVFALLSTRVELATPASQRQVATLASLSTGLEAEKLRALASDELYASEILGKRFSLLDLLEDYPSCKLGFAAYLDMLPPLGPREYSISSSPVFQNLMGAEPKKKKNDTEAEEEEGWTVSLTYDVHTSPSHAHPSTTFHGVASSYLASRRPGARLRCFVRHTALPFRLPADPKTPVIMVAAGTGIAPMRAFIQDRAAIAAARGVDALGQAVLYFGCRDFEQDYLYRAELEQWQREGLVTVRPAFSKRAPPPDEEGGTGGYTGHVDGRMWADRAELRDMFRAGGAKILVCGSAAGIGRSTAEVCLRVYREVHPEETAEEAEAWLARIKETRYISDVF